MSALVWGAATVAAAVGLRHFTKEDEITIKPGLAIDVIPFKKVEKEFGLQAGADTSKPMTEVGIVKPLILNPLVHRKSGPLPAQAIAAQEAGWTTANNNIRSRGQWFDPNRTNKAGRKKRGKLRFYADPPAVARVVVKNVTFNICWMARASWADYPRFGPGDQSCRLKLLSPIIGPKAALKAFGKGLKKWFDPKLMEDRLRSGGIIASAIISGGQSFSVKGKKQIEQVTKTLKNDWRVKTNTLKGKRARKRAAAAMVEEFGANYRRQIGAANPWLMRGGRVDISPRFMANPKTYADLYKPGKSWPLIYNPPEDITQRDWPNR